MKQVNQQVKQAGDPKAIRLEQQRQEERKRKELEKKRMAEVEGLFKPVITQKLNKGIFSIKTKFV